MIQFKRGKNWQKVKTPLADGQPGYDKNKNKLKIGNGSASWDNLPYLIGELDMENLIQRESKATEKVVFTYGKSEPTEKTKGQIYLQEYDGAVEADYVVETGRDTSYFFRKWASGFIECWGTVENMKSARKKCTDGTIFEYTSENYFELKGFWKQ